MRMGVRVGGRAVRGPARVAQADVPRGGRFLQLGGKIVDPAGGLRDVEAVFAFGLVVDRDHPGPVVTAILKPTQSLDQKVDRFLGSHVADDSTHNAILSWTVKRLSFSSFPILLHPPGYCISCFGWAQLQPWP